MPHRAPSAERLLRQRAELLEEVVGFATHLGPDGRVLDVPSLRRALARFGGRLRAQASAEDAVSVGSRDERAAAIAAFEAFVTRWHAFALEADAAGFARELRAVTARLAAFLRAEDDPAKLAV